MLLTHNDGRLARQVDKPRFAGPHEVCSPESSHERDDATPFVGMGIEAADAAMSWTTRHREGG
jgi:hypothetical protein